MGVVAEEEQGTLFNLKSKEIDPYWVDPKQPLKIPAEPLHVKAHRLQLLLERLDNQAAKNAAQFNSANYMAILNEYIKTVEQIKEGKTAGELLKSGSLGNGGDAGRQAPMGDGTAPGVGAGVSADNPAAG